MYASFAVLPRPDGTVNSRIPASANGIAMRSIHGLHFPNLDFVLSTIIPIIKSVIPSNTLDKSIIVPITPALT